jgi:excisionase family DNA binding protein
MANELNHVDEKDTANVPEYLSVKELSKKLNVSAKSIIHWTQTRQLPSIRMGRLHRYPTADIERRLMSGSLFSKSK